MDTVGIAIVGAGMMGRQHATSTKRLGTVWFGGKPIRTRLVGITAADAGQARTLARELRTRCFRSLGQLLASDEVDAVTIATPTDTHAELAIAALRARKHVFVEKPIARTLEQAGEIVRVARSMRKVLAVGHVIRYFPEYQALGDAIRRGDIGRPAVATFGRRCQWPDWAPDAWHTTGARSGGVVLDMMIHDIDLVRWYFGEPTRVFARCLGPDRHGGLDYGLATLHVPDGPICHLHASWAEPDGFSQSAEVCGSAGMLAYDSRGRDELQHARHGASTTEVTALPPPPPDRNDPFMCQLTDWVGAIKRQCQLRNDGAWALGSLRVALALLESNDRREPVELGAGAAI